MVDNTIDNEKLWGIERQLDMLLGSKDKYSWPNVYRLMEQVEREGLYKAQGFISFTGWVKAMALRYKVHVSTLWSQKKAGKYYMAYECRMQRIGVIPVPMDELRISHENIVFIEKIAGDNEAMADDLLERVSNGVITRSDLTELWESVKNDRKERGVKISRINAHDSSMEIHKEKYNATSQEQRGISTIDFILAIKKCTDWMRDNEEGLLGRAKYKVFTKFEIHKNLHKIDILVVENITSQDKTDPMLHGIEIKATRDELLSEWKLPEWEAYCDKLWIAVPEILEKEAIEVINSEYEFSKYGVILIGFDGTVRSSVSASYSSGYLRYITLGRALVKTM